MAKTKSVFCIEKSRCGDAEVVPLMRRDTDQLLMGVGHRPLNDWRGGTKTPEADLRKEKGLVGH